MNVSVGALQATEALESLLQPCFGPNGLDVLLERADGHAGCINSGTQLLSSLTLSHPAGLLLSRTIKEHQNICGDGSKKMVLMLAAALREVHKYNLAWQPGYPNLISLVEVSRALQHLGFALMRDIVPGLKKEAHISMVLQLLSCETVKSFCSRMMETSIGNRYSFCVKKKLMDVAMAMLFPDDVKDFSTAHKQLHYCQDNLHSLTTYLPGMAVSESQVFPGFIIDRDFINPPHEDELHNFHFLLLMSGLEWEEVGRSTTISVSSVDDLKGTVVFFSQYFKKLVECIHKQGIRLVLCVGKITSVARQLLKQYKISAIEMISEQTIQAMSGYLGVSPVMDTGCLPVFLANVKSHPVGVSCSYVVVGQKRFVHLTCLCGEDNMTSPHSVLLCAPTTGLCRQLIHRIGDMLRIINCFFKQEEPECLVGVAGGGAWEISLIRKLEGYLSTSGVAKDSPLWIAVKAFQKGLLAIPRTLLTSSLSQAFTGKLAAELHHVSTHTP